MTLASNPRKLRSPYILTLGMPLAQAAPKYQTLWWQGWEKASSEDVVWYNFLNCDSGFPRKLNQQCSAGGGGGGAWGSRCQARKKEVLLWEEWCTKPSVVSSFWVMGLALGKEWVTVYMVCSWLLWEAPGWCEFYEREGTSCSWRGWCIGLCGPEGRRSKGETSRPHFSSPWKARQSERVRTGCCVAGSVGLLRGRAL